MNILFYLVPKAEVVFVSDEDTVSKAMETLEECRYTSVPVLSRNGGYVGTLREGDILWGLKNAREDVAGAAEKLLVRQLKRYGDNQPVNINCDMEELLQTAMNQNFIPVIDDHKTFIGIVTRKSIISYCISQMHPEQETGGAV